MNVLKHGSKLASVGLLSLSMSAGFSGLAFAQTPAGTLTVQGGNTIVLDNTATSPLASASGFSAVINGAGLNVGDLYTLSAGGATCLTFLSPTQSVNTDQRATFGINGTGCAPGLYTITSVDTSANGGLGLPGPSTTIDLLEPSPSVVTTPPVTTPPVTTPPVTIPPITGPFSGPFNGQFNGQLNGQLNGTTTGQLNGTTTTGPFAGLTPAQIREAFEGANGTNSAAPTRFSGFPAGAALPARPARPTGAAGLTGRPTGLASRPAGLTGRSGRASRSTRATSQSSDDALLIALLEAIAR